VSYERPGSIVCGQTKVSGTLGIPPNFPWGKGHREPCNHATAEDKQSTQTLSLKGVHICELESGNRIWKGKRALDHNPWEWARYRAKVRGEMLRSLTAASLASLCTCSWNQGCPTSLGAATKKFCIVQHKTLPLLVSALMWS
jgi:hypothetical protein